MTLQFISRKWPKQNMIHDDHHCHEHHLHRHYATQTPKSSQPVQLTPAVLTPNLKYSVPAMVTKLSQKMDVMNISMLTLEALHQQTHHQQEENPCSITASLANYSTHTNHSRVC